MDVGHRRAVTQVHGVGGARRRHLAARLVRARARVGARVRVGVKA